MFKSHIFCESPKLPQSDFFNEMQLSGYLIQRGVTVTCEQTANFKDSLQRTYSDTYSKLLKKDRHQPEQRKVCEIIYFCHLTGIVDSCLLQSTFIILSSIMKTWVESLGTQ